MLSHVIKRIIQNEAILSLLGSSGNIVQAFVEMRGPLVTSLIILISPPFHD